MIPRQDFPVETFRRIPLSLGFMRKIAPTFPKSLPYRVDKKQCPTSYQYSDKQFNESFGTEKNLNKICPYSMKLLKSMVNVIFPMATCDLLAGVINPSKQSPVQS